MPLLNIGGVSGNNETLSFGVCFLLLEKEEDYTWAMDTLVSILETNDIQMPLCIITDRELALLNAIEALFPPSRHILCQWHVRMNVLAKTRRFFPAARRINDTIPILHPTFEAFLKEWEALLSSTSINEFNQRLTRFQGGSHPVGAVQYAVKTWIPWKEKLVLFWVD
jgi:hypothetical protein